MSASPPTNSVPSQKRPLDESSSPAGRTDQPDAKRPALEKTQDGETVTTEGGDTAAPPKLDVDVDEKPDAAALIGPVENGTKDLQGDTAVPDAPSSSTVAPASDASTSVTVGGGVQSIQTTVDAQEPSSASQAQPSHQDESSWIHLRAVISSAEAATIIGKAGENVTQIRKLSGAKCTVSDYSRGAVERILTVSGLVDAVAKVAFPPKYSVN